MANAVGASIAALHAMMSTPILTFGNARIAFVILSAVGSGDRFYGTRRMICIFRNQGDGWRILQVDPNASAPTLPLLSSRSSGMRVKRTGADLDSRALGRR